MKQTGKGTSPKIANVYPPEQHNAGTQLFVEVEPIDGAAEYRGYVSAYPDGRGAKALGVSATSKNRYARYVTKPNQVYYYGLQAACPMYLFITAVDAEGNESKPSAIRPVVLKDEFPFK